MNVFFMGREEALLATLSRKMALCVCGHARSVFNTILSHCSRARSQRHPGSDVLSSPDVVSGSDIDNYTDVTSPDEDLQVCVDGILNRSRIDDGSIDIIQFHPSSNTDGSQDRDSVMSPTIFSDCVIAGQSHIVTHLRTVTGIIEAKAQAMAAKASGQSRLHIACSTGHLDIVLCLLNHGADVHARDKNGVTPLHSACQIGSLEVIEALLSCGSDIDSQTYEGQETGLVVAASLGHVSCVDFLIKNKADVSLSRSHNFLPLHEAASRGHTEVARLLLDAGNDVNAAPNSGWTALHAAAYYGYPDLVDLLISRGADVNKKTADGVPPLHLAVGRGSKGLVDIVRKIIQTGQCNLDFADRGGNTALHKAIYDSRKEILKYLINCGANLDQKNKNGYTPFHRAADRLCISSCNLLVEAGCNLALEAWIEMEQFPISLARRKGTVSWLKSLIKTPSPASHFPSLQLQCRRIIRQAVCHWDVDRRVESLPIPKTLRDFILLN